ncbi:MAG: bifunctional adenosylcobinamide kinase/adenosylcobinamide-phosphate guanylyltransferase [Acidimicrobiia bacterium]
MIALVLGGTRSGKSEIAERIASEFAEPVTFIATATVTDPEMAARIEAHRARRPPTWRTIECGDDLVSAVAGVDGTVLVDSLGAWVTRTPGMEVDAGRLVAALEGRRDSSVLVSEEVGLSVHAPTEAGRRFTDALGTLNRAVADVADRVLLVVAGRVLPLPTPDQAPGPS